VNLTSKAAVRQWLSFHIYLPDGVDRFLGDEVESIVDEEMASGTLKRFFYIRYGKGDELHIRLRLLPRCDSTAEYFQKRLEDCLGAFTERMGATPGYKVAQARYDRDLHYFGQTPDSVYAELLNEHTSRVAGRILRLMPDDLASRFFVVGCVVRTLIPYFGCESIRDAVARNLRLSVRILSITPEGYAEVLEKIDPRFAPRLCLAWSNLSHSIREDAAVVALKRVIGRTARRNLQVVVHGIHLLCNKTGLSAYSELLLFISLIQACDRGCLS
jgi:thiopeptide-type bacteriocin biosynthesis protein